MNVKLQNIVYSTFSVGFDRTDVAASRVWWGDRITSIIYAINQGFSIPVLATHCSAYCVCLP